ncbi:hypothetical protein [Hymenobacter arizonensis]|uniref:Uncharacterized protein n=1 Tax=Hymenobacter arizonensis TaxID=1227077 RepID=A0A1I6BNA4_HYMAR|nr:hypothetical protein [Hymenobacter arizonensis]SFQ82401.1 hypothetical protein SAMN04515668_4803 [Hymenobacter arizonensis]
MRVLLLDEMAPVTFALYVVGVVVGVPLYGALLVLLLASRPTRFRAGLFLAGVLLLLGVYGHVTFVLPEIYYVDFLALPFVLGMSRLLAQGERAAEAPRWALLGAGALALAGLGLGQWGGFHPYLLPFFFPAAFGCLLVGLRALTRHVRTQGPTDRGR